MKIKPVYQKPVTILAALFLMSAAAGHNAFAYLDGYPPFQKGQFPSSASQISPIADMGKPGKIQVGNISVINKPLPKDKYATQIFLGSKKIFDSTIDHEDEWVRLGSRVFVHDLTGDGEPEILVYSFLGGVGIASGIEKADLFISQKDGSYKRVRFQNFYSGPEDWVDTNGDGQYEMIWLTLCGSSGHSYWVYRSFKITEGGLVLDDKAIPGFPRIIWFTEKPNDKPTAKLTPKERKEVLAESLKYWNEDYRIIE